MTTMDVGIRFFVHKYKWTHAKLRLRVRKMKNLKVITRNKDGVVYEVIKH